MAGRASFSGGGRRGNLSAHRRRAMPGVDLVPHLKRCMKSGILPELEGQEFAEDDNILEKYYALKISLAVCLCLHCQLCLYTLLSLFLLCAC